MSSDSDRAGFRTLLRRFRVAAGLTQEALADRAGLATRSIQDLEQGVHQPRRETLARLVRALALVGERRTQFEAVARATPRQRRVIALPRRFRAVPTETAEISAPRHNMPVQVTSFVGRGRELAEVKRLLADTHLLTLTGTGGCGKTRLALQVATDLADAHPDGVWLVELAPLVDPVLVPDAVAAALGVREGPGQPIQATLLSALRARRLLLVLDNCEHLIDSCARLTDAIVRSCPDVRILATSREALGIAGEVSRRVPSLEVPPVEPDLSREAAVESEAVRLFVERASAVQPGFRLTEVNASTIGQICVRLDGIPLAIELAAIRVKVLAVEQIAARMDQRFRLLTGGNRAALPRHQTLAATVGWSYDLLTAPERTLFNRLSVFAGGFTLEATEEVCTEGARDQVPGVEALGRHGDVMREMTDPQLLTPNTQNPIPPDDVLDLLSQLVDKSLVIAEGGTGGVERYRLLETLRQYGRERLVAAGEAEVIPRRHAAYFLAVVDDCVRQQTSEGPGSRNWDVGLETEQANLRAALAWYRDNDPATGLRLAAGLGWYWVFHDDLVEGEGWLSTFLAQTPGKPAVRGRALLGLATLKRNRGDLDAAQLLYEESLSLCRQVDDRWGIARSLGMLAQQARSAADYEQAIVLTEESLAIARQMRVQDSIMWGLFNLAQVYQLQGDLGRARSLADEALRISPRNFRVLYQLVRIAEDDGEYHRIEAVLREVLTEVRERRARGDAGRVLHLLGRLTRKRGDRAQARRLCEESLAIARATGLNDLTYYSLYDLGNLAWADGDRCGAHSRFAEWLNLAQRVGNRQFIALGLLVGVQHAGEDGALGRAVRLFGAADLAMPQYRFETDFFDLADYERILAAARAALDAEAFATT